MEEKDIEHSEESAVQYEEPAPAADENDERFEYRAVRAEHKYRKPPEEKKPKKVRYGITHSTAAKTFALILCILMLCVTAAAVAGAIAMFATGCYWTSEEKFREDTFRDIADSDDYNIIYRIEKSRFDDLDLDDFLGYKNIGYVKVESEDPDFETYERDLKPIDERYVFTFYWLVDYDENGPMYYSLGENYDRDKYLPESIWKVTIGIASELEVPDDYYWLDLLITVIYIFRFWVYPIGIVAFMLAILCFVFLMSAAGKRRDAEGVTPTMLTKIPFEIPTAAMVFAAILGFFVVENFYYSDLLSVIAIVIWAIASAIMLIFWLMSLAIRIKLGTLLKNTIIYRICRFIWRALCFCGRCIRTVVLSIPMIWKTILLIGAVAIVEFFTMALSYGETDVLFIWWFIGKLIAVPCVIVFAIMLRRLERGGREIADGNLDYKVDTKYLIFDCKKHGEDLNRIGEGLNLAVDERLKSERMKTELITNVSHDIKTPLTSIINYSDLICREECDNENIKEYASVLHNQSERMKRLIDDLVEASKASSGNLDIMLAECDARVLISQASGEYCQRLADAGLELVCSAPENEVKIMADGRRIWRVFDNLMGNARKYALPGTRVYVSLEEVGGNAVFRFKNISREALAVDANELTERFVRGDASRNTEGNGLGLSIAKSLVELQGGHLDITVDGDLFKVTLTFPIIKNRK